MENITIIGSGFCGTALAVHLLSRATGPLRISLINRSGRLARGLAYGTHSASHILNVPAGRMSLLPDHPSDFLDFARLQMPQARPGDFLPRRLYGDYLQHRLGHAIAEAAPGVRFSSLCAQVIDIVEQDDHHRLILEDGQHLDTQRTVIATGNFTPATPPSLNELIDDPRYIRDPWQSGALERIPASASVLLLGTGLTMYDMALALQDQGHNGPITALSRRALLPQAHRDNAEHPIHPELPQRLHLPMRLSERLVQLRQLIREAARDGHDWRDLVAALRPLTPLLWQQLNDADRRRFLRHLQPYWDVHRHRAAPPVAQRIANLRASGQLRICAGRVMSAHGSDSDLTIEFRSRGTVQSVHERYDYLINCTGPSTDLHNLQEPLLRSLLGRGLIVQDTNRLGLHTDDEYRLLNAAGNPQPKLLLLSPMLRARYWESTAVPELRQHAERLAKHLLEI